MDKENIKASGIMTQVVVRDKYLQGYKKCKMLGLEWYSKYTEDKIGREIQILTADPIESISINGERVYSVGENERNIT